MLKIFHTINYSKRCSCLASGQVVISSCGLWTSELYSDGAQYLVNRLDISLDEFRNTCSHLETNSQIPKERYFDRFKNVHQVNNLNLFTSWGLTQEQQKSVVLVCPRLLERKSKHLDSLRTWFMETFKVPPNDFRRAFVSCPWLLCRSTEEKVSDILELFKDAGFDESQLKTVLIEAPRTFHFPTHTQAKSNIESYIDTGLSLDELVSMLVIEPELLGVSFIDITRKRIRWLAREIIMHKTVVVHKILAKHPDLVLKSDLLSMHESLQWLQEQKVKTQDIRRLVLKQPSIVLNTSRKNMRVAFLKLKPQIGIKSF